MAWTTSDRAARLPRDWAERRAFVAARAAGRCEAALNDGSRCEGIGAECDHIRRGDDHRVENLQWLCSWHHKRKTRREALTGLAELRAARQPRRRPHPGLIDGGDGEPRPGGGGGDPAPRGLPQP